MEMCVISSIHVKFANITPLNIQVELHVNVFQENHWGHPSTQFAIKSPPQRPSKPRPQSKECPIPSHDANQYLQLPCRNFKKKGMNSIVKKAHNTHTSHHINGTNVSRKRH